MNWKGFGRNRGQMEVYPDICMKGLRKATKNLSHDSWCPPKHRFGVLPNWSKWNEVYGNHAEKALSLCLKTQDK
jgi:hypothetical protein